MDDLNLFDLNKYYQLYYRRTYLFAKSYVHDQWAAEDIASDALAKLWETMEKKEVRCPVSFLFSIVKNRSIDYLRHEAVRQEACANLSHLALRELDSRITALEAYAPANLHTEDIQKIINHTLNNLPERTREIFLMNRCLDISKNKIAKDLNLTPKGVDYHMAKALKSLRVNLKEYL